MTCGNCHVFPAWQSAKYRLTIWRFGAQTGPCRCYLALCQLWYEPDRGRCEPGSSLLSHLHCKSTLFSGRSNNNAVTSRDYIYPFSEDDMPDRWGGLLKGE